VPDILNPLRQVIDSQIHFADPRVGPAFFASMELLFNDLEIGLYRPSDRCSAGLENLGTLLGELAEENQHEIMSKEEKEIEVEEAVEVEVEEEEEEIILTDDDEDIDEVTLEEEEE